LFGFKGGKIMLKNNYMIYSFLLFFLSAFSLNLYAADSVLAIQGDSELQDDDGLYFDPAVFGDIAEELQGGRCKSGGIPVRFFMGTVSLVNICRKYEARKNGKKTEKVFNGVRTPFVNMLNLNMGALLRRNIGAKRANEYHQRQTLSQVVNIGFESKSNVIYQVKQPDNYDEKKRMNVSERVQIEYNALKDVRSCIRRGIDDIVKLSLFGKIYYKEDELLCGNVTKVSTTRSGKEEKKSLGSVHKVESMIDLKGNKFVFGGLPRCADTISLV